MITISIAKAKRIVAAFLLVMSVLLYFWITPAWVSDAVTYGSSPRFLPNVLSLLMFFVSIWVIIEAQYEIKREKAAYTKNVSEKPAATKAVSTSEDDTLKSVSKGDESEEDALEKLKHLAKIDEDNNYCTLDPNGALYVLWAVLGVIFYCVAAPVIHFIPTVIIIAVVLMYLYGQRKILNLILIPTILSVSLYYFFNTLLRLVLP